jgi:hypothetical protein
MAGNTRNCEKDMEPIVPHSYRGNRTLLTPYFAFLVSRAIEEQLSVDLST